MADDSSNEEPVRAPKRAPAVVDTDSSEEESAARRSVPKAKAKAEAKQVVDTSSSEDEAPAKPAKVAAVKTAAKAADTSSDEEVVAKPKAKAASRPVVETDSDDESPARIAPKVNSTVPATADTSSDEEALPARPAVKQPVKDADDSDEEPTVVKSRQQDTTSKAKLVAAAEETKKSAPPGSKQKGEDELEELRVIAKGLPFKAKEGDVRTYFSKCGDIKHIKVLLDEKGDSRGVAFVTFTTSSGAKEALKRNGDKEAFKGRTLNVERALKFSRESKGVDSKKNKKQNQTPQKDTKVTSGEGGSSGSTADPNAMMNQDLFEKLMKLEQAKDFASLEKMGEKIIKTARSLQQKYNEQMVSIKKNRYSENTVFVKGLPAQNFNEEAFQRRFTDCGHIKYVWLPLKADGETKGFGTVAFSTEEAFQKALKYDGTKCKGSVLSVVKSEPSKKAADAKVKEDATGTKKEESAVEKTPKRKASTEDVSTEAGDKQPKKKKKMEAATDASPGFEKPEKTSKKDVSVGKSKLPPAKGEEMGNMEVSKKKAKKDKKEKAAK